MEKWIFQDIVDIKNNVLYANMHKGKSFKESSALYKEALRKKIKPELYVRYIINGFDIYLDIIMVKVTAQNVYPELSEKQIFEWINKYKSDHHILTT